MMQKKYILLVSAIVCSLSDLATAKIDLSDFAKKAKTDDEKKGDVHINETGEAKGEGLVHLDWPQHQQWGWLSPPLLLSRYWHMSPTASPTYKLNVNDEKFELVYHVEGYKKDEVRVELSSEDNVLHVRGEQVSEGENDDCKSKSISKFHHTFSLDPNVHTDKVTAEIRKNGDLVVTVPRKIVSARTKIPITNV